MRDRLIELIRNAPRKDVVYGDIKLDKPAQTLQTIADHLLENGVIVMPCKVGDTVWMVAKVYADVDGVEKHIIFKGEVVSVSMQPEGLWTYCRYEEGWDYWHKCVEDFGKIVFLTKEEAEQALKEREQSDR